MDSLLFDAVGLDNVEDVRNILSKGGDVNAVNSCGNTLLHEAVKNENEEMVQLLVDAGADVNLQNRKKMLAIHFAYYCVDPMKKIALLKILVKAGSNVGKVKLASMRYRTVLLEAATTQDADLVKLILDRGADIKATDICGRTVLHHAASKVTSDNPEVFEVLLSANADVNAGAYLSLTPLHALCQHKSKVSPSLRKIVEVFSKYNANFNALDNEGRTPIDLAIEVGHSQAIEALVRCGGVNVNQMYKLSSKGTTILHEACNVGDISCVKVLLKNGANVNALDDDYRSPLRYIIDGLCLSQGEPEIVSYPKIKLLQFLLSFDPDVNIMTTRGLNILTPHCSGQVLPCDLWKTILEHLAKLRVLEKPICESLLDTISNKSEYESYFSKCKNELLIMKSNELYSHNRITPFDLMINHDKKKLSHYAGNVDLVKDITSIKFFKKFPIYGPHVYNKFSKAMKKRKIWDQAAEALSTVLPVSIDPTHQVIKEILSYFNKEELRKLKEQ